MNTVRIGVVGVGGMGSSHAKSILSGKIPGVSLTAVCDPIADFGDRFPGAATFRDSREFFRSGAMDAVLIATPHFSHTSLGIDALEAGLHVLVEKPISVHKADCERLLAVPRRPDQVFAAMFNMRTSPVFQKVRQLIQSGELGEIRRIQWTITNWFRSYAYYGSGKWRATWAGEGGGVLLNQCPHQLDLWQWLFGMPDRVRAFCAFGKYHDIEVEDDVTAYMEYKNGATGVFITSTGEAPGTNRLEIAGEQGRLLVEGDAIRFTRNEIQTSEYSRTTTNRFGSPPVWDVRIPVAPSQGYQHSAIIENFAAAIASGAELFAPAEEGIHSVELCNAMLLSTFQDRTIEFPMDSAVYEAELNKRIDASKSRDGL